MFRRPKWPNFVRTHASRRHRPKFGRYRAESGPMLAEIGPTSSRLGRNGARRGRFQGKFGRCRAKLAQTWSSSTQVRPTSTVFNLSSTQFGTDSANFGRFRPMLARCQGKLACISENLRGPHSVTITEQCSECVFNWPTTFVEQPGISNDIASRDFCAGPRCCPPARKFCQHVCRSRSAIWRKSLPRANFRQLV